MKKHYYQFGNTKCYTYWKTVGVGYEVGFYFGKTQVFVGNFIHKAETTKWWALMNREIKQFTRRYSVGKQASVTWYTKFFSHYLYKSYYSFLDHQFTKYQKTHTKAWKTDVRKYNTFKKNWHGTHVYSLKSA